MKRWAMSAQREHIALAWVRIWDAGQMPGSMFAPKIFAASCKWMQQEEVRQRFADFSLQQVRATIELHKSCRERWEP